MKKQLSVPYIADMRQAAEQLTCRGVSVEIRENNWAAYEYRPKVELRAAHDSKSLFLSYQVEESGARAFCLDDNGPVWEDSCVEFFVKLEDSPYYFNIEANCIGSVLAAKRIDRWNYERFNETQLSKIIRCPSLPRKVFSAGEEPISWTLLLVIPFELIDLSPDALPSVLEANFYKCADKSGRVHYLSWNPIHTEKPDFHRPEYFGRIFLEPVS